MLGFYLWQAGAGAINALLVVMAADNASDPKGAPGWVFGAANLVLVTAWLLGHLVLAAA